MLLPLIALAASNPAQATAPPVASLQIADPAGAELLVQIRPSAEGYAVSVDCSRNCPAPIHFIEPVADQPLGLFKLWDGDDLVYSVWSAGSAYRVRVWTVSSQDVTRVLETSSRASPAFLTGPTGAPMVRTFELDRPGAPFRPVAWRYEAGRFSKSERAE